MDYSKKKNITILNFQNTFVSACDEIKTGDTPQKISSKSNLDEINYPIHRGLLQFFLSLKWQL